MMIPVVIEGSFGAYHWAPGPAVLICPPFGYEANATQRIWRDLARRLVEVGVAVLRLDLPGTGNAAGHPTDPGQVPAWQAALDAAITWLGARHGGRVALLGHRFGALLALDAAARGAKVERLVLLDPPATGALFARGLRARARLEQNPPAPEGPDFIQAWDVPLSTETLAGLAALPADPQGRALPPVLLAMPGPPDTAAWPAWLAREPDAVTAIDYAGHDRFAQQESLVTQAPEDVFARIVATLGAAATATMPAAPPPLPMTLDLPEGTEETIRFGAGGLLVGTLTHPRQPNPDAAAVVLPSIGNLPRCGYARLWTDLARVLAAQGIASLRFDAGQVGDSEGEEQPDRLAASYATQRIAEVRDAVDAMARRGHPRSLLIGHCSGAYAGWLAALQEPRIVGLLVSNPQFLTRQTRLSRATLHRPPGMAETDPRLQASDKTATPPRSQFQPSLLQRLKRRCPLVVRHALRRLGAEERATRQALRTLTRRGCAVHFVFAAGDSGMVRLQRAFGEVPRLPRLAQLSVIEGADHNFAARQHRAQLLHEAAGFALRAATPRRPTFAAYSPAMELPA